MNDAVQRIKLLDFFNHGSIYSVPVYQRKYVWKEDNIKLLFEDIKDLLNENNSKNTLYLGNILINNDKNNIKWIVDGQQRITTFILLFKALIDEIESRINNFSYSYIDENKNNLNKLIYMQDSNEPNKNKIRLKISEKNNREKFKTLIESSEYVNIFDNKKELAKIKRENKSNIFFTNYIYFRYLIREFLEEINEENIDIDEIIKIFENIWVIKINLQENDNELKIFETLNSKGTPLNAIDLIKNIYFMKLHEIKKEINSDKEQIKELEYEIKVFFEQFLFEKISKWNKDPKKDNIEFKKLFKEYIIYKSIVCDQENSDFKKISLPKENDPKDLYVKFKLLIETEFNDFKTSNDISKSIDDLNKFLMIKNMVKKYKISSKKTFLKDYEISFMILNDLYTGSQFFPIIVQLLNNKEEIRLSKNFSKIEWASNNFNNSLLFLEKMIIRRQFTGKGTRLLTRTINKIRVKNYNDLYNEFANKKFIPEDYEFKEGLNRSDVYSQKSNDILKGFFWRIELQENEMKRTYENINHMDSKDKLTIEHIMPQKLNKEWRNALNINENNKEDYEKNLHKLGNLTITADNNIIGNKSFLEKKEKHYQNSVLKINRKISEYDKWDFSIINNRTEELIEKAIQIWN